MSLFVFPVRGSLPSHMLLDMKIFAKVDIFETWHTEC
jgi:hypothetical protein